MYHFEKSIQRFKFLPISFILMLSFIPMSLFLPSSITRNAMLYPLLKEVVQKKYPWESKRIYLTLGLINPIASSAFLTGGLSALVTASLLGGISWGKWLLYMSVPYYLMMICGQMYILLRYPVKGQSKLTQPVDTKRGKLPFKKEDWLIVITMVGVTLLWISDTWHKLHPAAPALIGVLVLFIFTQSIEWNDIKSSSVWENVMIIGALLSLIEALNRYGGFEILTSWVFKIFPVSLNDFILVLLCILITIIFNLFIPNITVCVTFLVPLFIQLSLQIGVNPIVTALVTTMTVDSIKFYPSQSTPLLMVYDRNKFGIKDVFHMGATLLIMLIIIVLFLILPYWKLIGVEL